ncbi:MAG: NAD(P)-dependent oxidoreductase [Chloroflexi bacterium]|nr:MAG: NAD(P)-dependent oxidoreductase [Chloroflexota bacterium]
MYSSLLRVIPPIVSGVDTLRARVALVTGAARGQGRAHAVALARAGADVAVCDLGRTLPTVPYALGSVAELGETAALVQAEGRRCISSVVDVRDAAALAELVEETVAELGRLDILVANAGVISYGKAWELSEAQWDEVVDVNLTGVWKSCRAAVPAMLAGGEGGAIVITASTASVKGLAGMSHYAAAKHGCVGLARSLALELAPHRIRVNCVAPGGVRTPMGTNTAMQQLLEQDPALAASLTAALPVDLVEPEDVSAAVVWLCSDAARQVTGTVLPLDAGTLLR